MKPSLFINTVGGGLCDDRASVLVRLWQALGYKARVIGLEGHVVAEVFAEGKWMMFDPDLRLFYTDQNGVMSVQDIERNPSVTRDGPLRGRAEYRHYLSEGDNVDITPWYLGNEDWDSTFVLPAGCMVVFGQSRSSVLIKVIVPKCRTGVVQTPFLPSRISGNALVNEAGEVLRVSRNKRLRSDLPVKSIEILHSASQVVIHYRVNPRNRFLTRETRVIVHGSPSLSVGH
jgi:hypothetical protein